MMEQKTGTMINTEKSSTASRTALRNFEVFVLSESLEVRYARCVYGIH